jgi:hypothetical protein
MSIPWTSTDDDTLRRWVDKGFSAPELSTRFDRPLPFIKQRLEQLNLRIRLWTHVEQTTLKQLWLDKISIPEIAMQLNYTPLAINIRAHSMGLHSRGGEIDKLGTGPVQWTAREDDFVREGVEKGMSDETIRRTYFGSTRTESAVTARRRKLARDVYVQNDDGLLVRLRGAVDEEEESEEEGVEEESAQAEEDERLEVDEQDLRAFEDTERNHKQLGETAIEQQQPQPQLQQPNQLHRQQDTRPDHLLRDVYHQRMIFNTILSHRSRIRILGLMDYLSWPPNIHTEHEVGSGPNSGLQTAWSEADNKFLLALRDEFRLSWKEIAETFFVDRLVEELEAQYGGLKAGQNVGSSIEIEG